MNLKLQTVSARASLAIFVMMMGLNAPAFAKPGRGEQRQTVVSPVAVTVPQDDRFPWLDQGYVAAAQASSKRERRARMSSRARTASRSDTASGTLGFGAAASFGGGSGLVAEARRYLGTNPTGRSSLWCGHFMNLVLERSGRQGSASNTARSFASYGSRLSGPQVGAIAVMSRGKGGGHVGIVSGIDAGGNPIIISGNHGRRVAESTYPRGRVYAYVMP